MLRFLPYFCLLVVCSNPIAAQTPSGSASDFVRFKGKPELRTSVHLIRKSNGEAQALFIGDSAQVALSDVVEFRSAGTYYQIIGVNATNTSVVEIEELLLQRTEEGPLDLYVYADRKAPDPDSYTFDYFSVNGQRPQLASSSRLRAVLGDHPESAEALRRARHYGRIQYGTAIIGGIILAYGLISPSFGDLSNGGGIPGFELNIFQPLGLGMMLYSLDPRHEKKRAWREAIIAYQNQ